jgi:hypothetical protein
MKNFKQRAASVGEDLLDKAGSVAGRMQEAVLDNSLVQSLLGTKEEEQPRTAQETGFSKRALGMFAGMDLDEDGFLSEDELDAGMVDPSLPAAEGIVASMLWEHSDEIQSLNKDGWLRDGNGVSAADLAAYELLEDGEGARGTVESDVRRTVEGLRGQSMALFGEGGHPTAAGAIQGSVGNCHFIAAMSSLADQRPGDIEEMITDNLDGSYTVTFPNESPVKVEGPTVAELAQFARGGSNGIWAPVMEKAYGRLKNPDAVVASTSADETVIGLASTGINLLTGGGANLDSTRLTTEETTSARLGSAMREKRLVTAGVGKLGGLAKELGLPQGHMYSVLDYDEAGGKVTIRNPWGHAERKDSEDGVDDGVFTVTVSEFMEIFDSVAYEGSRNQTLG